MTRVITTARVEDSAKWENAFRRHVELFNDYTATDNNEVAILWEVVDVDSILEQLDGPETAAAMAEDGVDRESVKVYVLNKELDL